MHCRFPVNQPWSRSSSLAFTLLEMVVAVALSTLVAAAVATLTMYTARNFVAVGNYADLDRVGRHAVDVMTADIRQATSLTAYATNQLVFRDLTNGTFSYTWNPSNTTLIRVYNGQSQLLLTNCDSLAFHIWQHTPSNNFNFWPATATTNAKLIDVSWSCSRSILGQKVNTESLQTAKIALRN